MKSDIERREPLTVEEERVLVDAARHGDKAAMDTLLRRHYGLMYHLALKITRDPVRAEDVTQDSCVQVLRWLDQFRSEARFGSWLSRIVVNSALLRHRRERRLVPSPTIYPTRTESPEAGPESVAGDREILAKTDSFLQDLRDGDRELFVLRFVDGMSLQGISEKTGISLPALKSRFHRARVRLKTQSEAARWGVDVAAAS